MKLEQVMTQNPKSCDQNTNLAAAAMMMWEDDCGIIPIVDDEQKVIGVITDRDICMAVATKHRLAEDIMVEEVVQGELFTCASKDDAKSALKLMKEHLIRRIPVVDSSGTLVGIVSINDLVLEAKETKGRKKSELGFADIIEALKSICGHRSNRLAA